MNKIFFIVSALIALLCAIFGFILPALISSKSNELPIIGFVVIWTLIALLVFAIGKIIKKLKMEKNNEKNS